MAKSKITAWGNSAGIRLSSDVLKEAKLHIGESVEIDVKKNGEIMLRPVLDPQIGWLEAFNAIAATEDLELLIDDIENDFDRNEWTW